MADEELRDLLRSAENILSGTTSKTNVIRSSNQPKTVAPLSTADVRKDESMNNASRPVPAVESFGNAGFGQEASDLANLLDSLSNDLKSELQPVSAMNSTQDNSNRIDLTEPTAKSHTALSSTASFSIASSGDSDVDFEDDHDYDFDSLTDDDTNIVEVDNKVTAVRFCGEYSLRGKLGLYLTAVPTALAHALPSEKDTSKSSSVAQHFLLGGEGQGVGDQSDCLQFINLNNKEDNGPVKYGMTVSLKAPAAKERLLGIRDGSKLGFWRNLIGQGEKWVVLKAATAPNGGSYYQRTAGSLHGVKAAPGSRVSCEEAGTRGSVVRVGDMVVLQTYKSDYLLTLQMASSSILMSSPSGGGKFPINGHNDSTSSSVGLVYRDRSGNSGMGLVDAEFWQIEPFGSIPTPLWCTNRPYLSGSYLTIPPSMKPTVSELEIRAFPDSRVPDGPIGSDPALQDRIVPLNTLSLSVQHLVLLRELLLALSCVEGMYIRVKGASNAKKALSSAAHTTHNNPVSLNNNSSSAMASVRNNSKSSAATNNMYVSIPLHSISLTLDAETADKSLAVLVIQLLPICESAIKVRVFIRQQSNYEYGLVSHALCAAVKRICREFDTLVAQLEHLYNEKKLSLQKLVFLLQPSKVTLYQLERLCLRLSGLTGGHLLDVLHAITLEQGDKKAREMHQHLLTEAYQPFLRMLVQWIYRGELKDPYREFMVLEDSSVSREALQEDFNAHYWDSRYRLRETHIPRLLRSHAIKMLSAGKYLNVIRGGGDLQLSETFLQQGSSYTHDEEKDSNNVSSNPLLSCMEGDMQQSIEVTLEISDSPLVRAIEDAYILSSNGLLKLLETGHGLSTHLSSLRRFFLLEHGDFFIQFMDTAEDELRKEVREVSLPRIQALLQLAVQTSTLTTDAHKEDLSCSLASHNLIQHLNLIQSAGDSSSSSPADLVGVVGQGLKGVEALTLDYKVGWPLSIVLSRRAITKYQLLSRLLYFSKHVERRVLASWMDHQYTKHLKMHIRVVMGPCYCLRHRMLHFLQNFVYYMTLEVIGPRGHELHTDLAAATDIDHVLELHEKFLDSCLKECLLASQELLKILTKIMTTCLLFADYMKKFSVNYDVNNGGGGGGGPVYQSSRAMLSDHRSRSVINSGSSGSSNVSNDRERMAAAYVDYVEREISHESFKKMLTKFTDTFDMQLKEFLDKLWTDSYRRHAQLSNLCIRLDYNGFYSSQFST